VVKIYMRGQCKKIQIIPNNGEPTRCMVQIELEHYISLEYRRYDIQLLVPAEFATLLEAGLPVDITLEQDGG
jgi:hypothetical protein